MLLAIIMIPEEACVIQWNLLYTCLKQSNSQHHRSNSFSPLDNYEKIVYTNCDESGWPMYDSVLQGTSEMQALIMLRGMDMERSQIIQKLHLVSQKFPDAPIYLFGSQVKGGCRRDSDLDIAVFHAKGSRFMEIEEALQNTNVPLTMEILCMEMIENDVLEREVLRSGIKV